LYASTALNLVPLVAAIKAVQVAWIHPDFDANQSFGSFYGTLFESVEPSVSAGTLGGGFTQVVDNTVERAAMIHLYHLLKQFGPVATLISTVCLAGCGG
jgi:hypothetical protein